jgi:hypothetical protein
MVRMLKIIFKDDAVRIESLSKDDALSDFFRNHGIDLVAPSTNVKQILFLGNRNLDWEDITADWIEINHSYDEIRVYWADDSEIWKADFIKGEKRNRLSLAVSPDADIVEAVETAISMSDHSLTDDDFAYHHNERRRALFACWEKTS